MQATDLQRIFVYHSPQYPGFSCWCGLWVMPDHSVMCSLTQATGPYAGRQRAPDEVGHRLSWPPEGHGDEYDMTGLQLANVHLSSTDAGTSWRFVSSDSFASCMNGTTGEAEVALADGSLLRGVWGRYLPYDDTPDDGFVQSSADGGCTWSAPCLISRDPARAFWPKRMRMLRDGRVLAGGGLFVRHPERDTRAQWTEDFVPALFVSDDGGRTWSAPMPVLDQAPDAGYRITEEFDWVELEDGDLLLILRAGTREGRLQTRLPRCDQAWAPGRVAPAGLPYSGHPELLRLANGAVLHVATTGVSYTLDEGATWQDLILDDGLAAFRSGSDVPYYPKSVQLADGSVLILGHVGGDNGYGCVDQSIVGLRFTVHC